MARTDDSEIQRARIALLQHFSSKSSNQTIILLTLALALFSLIQSTSTMDKWPQLLEVNWFILFPYWAIFTLIVRQLGRLIMWGWLARAICFVKALSNDEMKKFLKESERTPKHDPDIANDPDVLARLFYASVKYANEEWRGRLGLSMVSVLTRGLGLALVSIVTLIVLICSALGGVVTAIIGVLSVDIAALVLMARVRASVQTDLGVF